MKIELKRIGHNYSYLGGKCCNCDQLAKTARYAVLFHKKETIQLYFCKNCAVRMHKLVRTLQ